MLANTLVLTIGGVATTLTRINQDSYSSEYLFKDSVSSVVMRIRHTKTKANGLPSRDRHNVEVVQTVFADVDTAEIVRKTYFVIEVAPNDVSKDLPTALFNLALASTGALLSSLLGWES